MEHQEVTKNHQQDHHTHTQCCAKPALAKPTPVFPIQQLQRAIGNSAVGRLIQAKLRISEPGDASEQEADRVADRVMRRPNPSPTYEAGLSQQPEVPQIQRLCTDCEEKEAMRKTPEEEEDEKPAAGPIQTKTTSGAAPQVMQSAEPHVGESGGGGPLPNAVRSFFAARFGHDFGQVKLHTNTRAADSARSLNARAYTIGSDIAFAAGEYRPDTTEGRKLLAHELAHVVQQSRDGTRVSRWTVGPAPAPAGWEVITNVEQLRRLGQAETIVRSVLPLRPCQNFFSGGCRSPTALQDAFDNARIYLMPVDDNVFGSRNRPGADIAFNLRAFRIGRFMLASTLLHEMFHTCDPTVDQNTRELNSENAVETCHIHTPWIDELVPRRAAVGARVTIRGWNFGPVQGPTDEVRIGGVTAKVISWAFTTDTSSRVEIVVEVPAGTGAGGVVVINNRVASNAADFTVI